MTKYYCQTFSGGKTKLSVEPTQFDTDTTSTTCKQPTCEHTDSTCFYNEMTKSGLLFDVAAKHDRTDHYAPGCSTTPGKPVLKAKWTWNTKMRRYIPYQDETLPPQSARHRSSSAR
mmetsp:Transcript_165441/g.525844  ORF Transcript_165441/g.525844 Transcript_165441/m.525844 type:complete len:116 (+) Transcript_165441:366-713(+)